MPSARHTHQLITVVYGAVVSLFTLPLVAQTVGHDDPEHGPAFGNTTQAGSCPGQGACHLAAAIAVSLVGGFILGAIVTYFAVSFLRKRRQHLPPKDYDVTESSHLDVNRNSDDNSQYLVHAQVTLDPPEVKGHKKLERLVKQSHTSPGDIETTQATAPLIPSDGVSPEAVSPTNPATTNTPVLTGLGGDIVYANVGAGSLLTQPYESLEIIPEEWGDHERPGSSTYEGFSQVPAAK